MPGQHISRITSRASRCRDHPRSLWEMFSDKSGLNVSWMSLECLLNVSEPNVFWRFHSATAISLALVELQEELAKHARHQMTAKEKRQQQAMLIDAWTEIGYFLCPWTDHLFAHHRHAYFLTHTVSVWWIWIDMDRYGGLKKPASARIVQFLIGDNDLGFVWSKLISLCNLCSCLHRPGSLLWIPDVSGLWSPYLIPRLTSGPREIAKDSCGESFAPGLSMLSKSLGKRLGMSTDENGWARVLCRHFRLRLLFLLLHYESLLIKGSLGGETSVLRTFRMSRK